MAAMRSAIRCIRAVPRRHPVGAIQRVPGRRPLASGELHSRQTQQLLALDPVYFVCVQSHECVVGAPDPVDERHVRLELLDRVFSRQPHGILVTAVEDRLEPHEHRAGLVRQAREELRVAPPGIDFRETRTRADGRSADKCRGG